MMMKLIGMLSLMVILIELLSRLILWGMRNGAGVEFHDSRTHGFLL